MMQNPIKRPTYNELVELSNGDLIKRIRLALEALTKAKRGHQSTTEKDFIYHAYDNERLKRLKLASGKLMCTPETLQQPVSCRL